jgi:hypothetical protein
MDQDEESFNNFIERDARDAHDARDARDAKVRRVSAESRPFSGVKKRWLCADKFEKENCPVTVV